MVHTAPVRAVIFASTVALAGCSQCGGDLAARHVTPSTVVADDATVDGWIRDQSALARDEGKRVLIVYVGDDDEPDTRLVRRYLAEEPAASALARAYEIVFVNVKSDLSLHARLRHADDVTALVTFVAVDPASGRRVARRVFAPATGRGTVTSATLAAWLDDPHGR